MKTNIDIDKLREFFESENDISFAYIFGSQARSARLARLEDCLKRLKEVAGEPLDKFVADQDLQDKAERNFQVAAQCCIDIGSHILAGKALGVPESYEMQYRSAPVCRPHAFLFILPIPRQVAPQ